MSMMAVSFHLPYQNLTGKTPYVHHASVETTDTKQAVYIAVLHVGAMHDACLVMHGMAYIHASLYNLHGL